MNTKGLIYLFGSSCIFLYVMIFSISPMMGEDFGLTKRFTSESILERIEWAIQRSELQSVRWNARLGEQLAIFSLSMPSVFMTFTSLTCILVLIFTLSKLLDSEANTIDKFFICSCFMFFMMPGFEVFFWKTANAGYLQTMTLTLLAIIPFVSQNMRELVNNRKVFVVLHVTVCFLAGMSFENTPIAVIILACTLVAFKQLSLRDALLPVIAIISGWLLLMLSPSTSIRSAYYKKVYHVTDMSFDYFLNRAADVISVFFSTSTILFVIATASLIYLALTRKLSVTILCLILSAILVVGSMCLSPYTEARGFLYAWCIMIAVVVYTSTLIFHKYKTGVLLPVIAGFLSLTQLSAAYSAYSEINLQAHEREYEILSNIGKEKCKSGINIRLYKTNYSYKYVNNRDVWFVYNPEKGTTFYNCLLLNK